MEFPRVVDGVAPRFGVTTGVLLWSRLGVAEGVMVVLVLREVLVAGETAVCGAGLLPLRPFVPWAKSAVKERLTNMDTKRSLLIRMVV